MVDRKVVLYVIAVVAAVGGVASQYVIPSSLVPAGLGGLLLGLFLAYGIGLLAFFFLVGTRPLRNFARRNVEGVKEGIRWYGIYSVIGLLLVFLILIVLISIEPQRVMQLESNTTPVVQAGEQDPVFYILLSLLVIGFAEETIFRGYILGTILTLKGTKDWRVHAVWTSLLFASLHLYYSTTYLELSVIDYAEIVTLGLAFAYAYVLSGGNILVIALLHGSYDAVSFWGLMGGQATYAEAFHFLFILLAVLWALYLYLTVKPGPELWNGQPMVPAESWPPGPTFGAPAPMPLASGAVPAPTSGPPTE